MQAALLTVLILITELCQVRIAAAGTKQQMLLNENFDRCKAFTCGPPQRRAFRIEEIFDLNLTSCEEVRPHMTVLYRCDASAGCCKDKRSQCRAAASEEVPLAYMITVNNSAGCSTNSRIVETTAVNHTRCECKTKNDIK